MEIHFTRSPILLPALRSCEVRSIASRLIGVPGWLYGISSKKCSVVLLRNLLYRLTWETAFVHGRHFESGSEEYRASNASRRIEATAGPAWFPSEAKSIVWDGVLRQIVGDGANARLHRIE